MSRIITYDLVKESLDGCEYTLLSKEYINARTKLYYICPKGHKHSMTWCHWQQGQRCPYCDGNAKLTLEQVTESFKQEGYVLLSKEYTNAKTKLNYICPKGHKHSMAWSNWQQSKRCPSCAGLSKLTLEHVKEDFEKEGCILLSKEYINARTKLYYICPKGHNHDIVWGGWQRGQRCPVCAGLSKPSLKQVKESFGNERYTLLSKVYTNNRTKLNYICPKGHKHSMAWCNWRQGYRCPTCDDILKSGPGHYNWQGGISCEPYCPIWSDKEYKKDIKLRDGDVCLNPYCSKKDHRLYIHHIDYNKKNCEYKNLITLCGSCNSRANVDREWHTDWYRIIMMRRYNYKY